MMKKRLSKTLWYGTDVDSYGNPIIPSFTADQHDLDGLHIGELFLHYSDGIATLWTANESGNIVKISGGEGGVDLSQYLLISEFNKIWEIRTDSQGTEYIFGKLPVVTQYGITMYSGDNVDIPSIAEGLPFDGRTIWFNPKTNQIEVLGGAGGGSGGGVSNFWDLSGIPSWITNAKPTYNYIEIQGTPDLSKYALASDIPSLSGYATEQWVLGKGYALSSDLSKYIPIAGVTDITGEKNFTGGLKVNGSPIYYDKEKKYWKLEGDLLVTGGVTMYGSDSSFTPSTIMDAIAVDGTTISKDGGILKVIGGTGGGISSVTSQMIVDALGYTPASATALSGYLPLSGGTIKSTEVPQLILQGESTDAYITFKTTLNTADSAHSGLVNLPSVGVSASFGVSNRIVFPFSGGMYYRNGYNGTNQTIWHAGNDGSGSGLDADLLDGVHLTKTYSSVSQIDFSSIMWKASGAIGETGFGSLGYAALLNVGDNISRGWQVWNSRNDHRLYWRAAKVDISGWGDIHVIIDNYNIKDYNAGSATKLQTARTIWGQNFDGTADVSGSIYFDSGTIGTYKTVKANDFTSIVAWKNTTNSEVGYVGYYSDHFIFANVANNTTENCAISAYDDGNITFSCSSVGIGTKNPSRMLDVVGNASVQALKISATSSTYHLEFSRGGANYLYAPSGGYIRFVTNGKGLSSSNADMIISDSSVTVQGNLLTTGGVTMYSDIRKKTKLKDVVLSLQQVANAPLIEHFYNSDDKKTTHVGSIAQYWAEMNDWFCKKDSEGFYTMEIQNAALASAISVARELVKFETETDRRIRLLEEENKRLKEEVEQLKWNIA